eukprot:2747727-Rhodomonas_salina.1
MSTHSTSCSQRKRCRPVPCPAWTCAMPSTLMRFSELANSRVFRAPHALCNALPRTRFVSLTAPSRPQS